MSIRVVFKDGCSERLLSDTFTDEVEREDGGESLDTLLGITEKDVVNLDDNDEKPVDGGCQSPDSEEKQMDGTEEVEGTTEDKDNLEDTSEKENDVEDFELEIDPEVDKGEDEPLVDDDGEADKGEKRDSIFDFKKLFGFDRETSAEKNDAEAGTSDADNRVPIQTDEAVHENDSENAQLIVTPSPNKADPTRPVSPVVLDRRKLERSVLKKQLAQRGKLLCGIVIVIILLCLSLGLLALAWWYGITDLFIIGGIFGGGAVVFFIIFVWIRCTTNTSVDYLTVYKADSPEYKV